jgi:uncharacterized membrane protein YphA (DoxX/SURF4 family)
MSYFEASDSEGAVEGASGMRATEAILRIVLGVRFLNSGVSNLKRWPHATETAAIISPTAAYPLGMLATALMVAGGAGLVLGVATRLAALLLVGFLLPTFVVHRHWLRVLPDDAAAVAAAIPEPELRSRLRLLTRHAVHAHETGMLENLVYLAACLYFASRGATGLSLDTWVCSYRNRR